MSVIQLNSLKQKINLGVVYCSPTCSIKKETFKSLLIELGNRYILGGDFNAKHKDWGSRISFTGGKELSLEIQHTGLQTQTKYPI